MERTTMTMTTKLERPQTLIEKLEQARCKMTDITITAEEFQDLIIYSARYTIGRMTYAPSQSNELIRKYLPKIHDNTLSVLIRDIESHDPTMLGMDFDKKMWLALLDTLKNERDRRKSEDETV